MLVNLFSYSCFKLISLIRWVFDIVIFYRDNGIKAIENLMKQRGKFDYILLETTGLADPGTTSFTFYILLFL